MLSKRAQSLKASPTLALVAKAKELQSKGHDVISLTVGEPDWATLQVAAEAGIAAIREGDTKYTAASGTIELRKAIAGKIKNDIGTEYGPNEIMVGPGAKFVIFSALQMICDPGDEIILHTPYWVSYPTMIELAGGVPKIVECGPQEGYKITAAQLEKAIGPKTKGFLFCSPSNPTGMMYTREELTALAEVFRRHPQLVILSDDIYNTLVFDETKLAPHLLQVAPELKDRLVAVNGASKSFAMTGWRMGWAAGPTKLIKAMGDYQSQATGAPSSIAQRASLAAIRHGEPEVAETVKTLVRRKNAGMAVLRAVKGFEVMEPQGAFYFWVNLRGLLGRTHESRKVDSDSVFCDILLNEYFVATVPGAECGSPGFMRLSFACSEESFAAAIERMKTMIAKFK
ncbi:MAG: pyridoxal phosphate-dependent aminotransferase [Bdellovibrionaceae bacterium]|nr:pyridoxal phosphate-dependent aminotransferase [Pseudobdellovibrionaceae bacterium]